jgi:hypothetical protein
MAIFCITLISLAIVTSPIWIIFALVIKPLYNLGKDVLYEARPLKCKPEQLKFNFEEKK